MSEEAFRRRIAVLMVALLSVVGVGATAGPADSDPGSYLHHIHVTYLDA